MTAETRYTNPDLADAYVAGRPTYPRALYDRIASLTKEHERAWDVGTGSGQAAHMVADYYKSVVATDVSEAQVARAPKWSNVTYSVLSSYPSSDELERVVGAEGTVDLITAASALHWFDLEKFYPLAKRMLRKPGGVMAAWAPTWYCISPEVDEILQEILLPYRAPELQYALDGYRTIPFPFDPVEGPAGRRVEPEYFEIRQEMTLSQFLVLIRSFDSIQLSIDNGLDPFNKITKQRLLRAWGSEDDVRTCTCPLQLLVGKVPEQPENCSRVADGTSCNF